MSADDFAALQKQMHPAGTAFTERLAAAQKEMAKLQAIEQVP